MIRASLFTVLSAFLVAGCAELDLSEGDQDNVAPEIEVAPAQPERSWPALDGLSEAEEQVLAEYSPEQLNRAIQDAEKAYVEADTPSDRQAAEERYDMVLNLAARLSRPEGPEMTPEEKGCYRHYEQTLDENRDLFSDMSEEEAGVRRATLKDAAFASFADQQKAHR